jgi:hypothetical protein
MIIHIYENYLKTSLHITIMWFYHILFSKNILYLWPSGLRRGTQDAMGQPAAVRIRLDTAYFTFAL